MSTGSLFDHPKKISLGIIHSSQFHHFRVLDDTIISIWPVNTIARVISGHNKDPVEKFTHKYGLEHITHLPDKSLGKRARYCRDKQIISQADHIIAFWDGRSVGTKMAIDHAKKMGIPVTIVVSHEHHVLHLIHPHDKSITYFSNREEKC